MADSVERYRRLRCSWPRDPLLAGQSHLTKLLAIYLESGPQTDAIPGLCRFSCAVAAEDLGCTTRAIEQAMARLAAVGFLDVWCPRERTFWRAACVETANPHSPANLGSWKGAFGVVPESSAKQAARTYLFAYCERRGPEFLAAFARAVGAQPPRSAPPVGPPKQEQEQEQEQEHQHRQPAAARPTEGERAKGGEEQREATRRDLESIRRKVFAALEQHQQFAADRMTLPLGDLKTLSESVAQILLPRDVDPSKAVELGVRKVKRPRSKPIENHRALFLKIVTDDATSRTSVQEQLEVLERTQPRPFDGRVRSNWSSEEDMRREEKKARCAS